MNRPIIKNTTFTFAMITVVSLLAVFLTSFSAVASCSQGSISLEGTTSTYRVCRDGTPSEVRYTVERNSHEPPKWIKFEEPEPEGSSEDTQEVNLGDGPNGEAEEETDTFIITSDHYTSTVKVITKAGSQQSGGGSETTYISLGQTIIDGNGFNIFFESRDELEDGNGDVYYKYTFTVTSDINSSEYRHALSHIIFNFYCVPTGTTLNVHKFYDENEDGVQDSGEEDLDGWTFYLYQDTCDSIGATSYTHGVTDVDGNITFSALPAGDYCIEEDLKDHWRVTTDGGVTRDVTLTAGSTVTETFGNKFNLEVIDNLPDVDVTQSMLEDELKEASEEGRRYLEIGDFEVHVSGETGSYTVVSYYLHNNATPCIDYSKVTGDSIIGIENGTTTIEHLSKGDSDPTELSGISGSQGSASYPTYIDLARIAEAGAPDTTCNLEIRVLFASSLP